MTVVSILAGWEMTHNFKFSCHFLFLYVSFVSFCHSTSCCSNSKALHLQWQGHWFNSILFYVINHVWKTSLKICKMQKYIQTNFTFNYNFFSICYSSSCSLNSKAWRLQQQCHGFSSIYLYMTNYVENIFLSINLCIQAHLNLNH